MWVTGWKFNLERVLGEAQGEQMFVFSFAGNHALPSLCYREYLVAQSVRQWCGHPSRPHGRLDHAAPRLAGAACAKARRARLAMHGAIRSTVNDLKSETDTRQKIFKKVCSKALHSVTASPIMYM